MTEKLLEKKRLKGGSLSGTYFCVDGAGTAFVRKEVSLKDNREYGFQRWYSQLKRLQRYSQQFPGLFPGVIKFGRDGDLAYFDIEYIGGSITAHDYLLEHPPQKDIEKMLSVLLDSMGRMHSIQFPSTSAAMDLYVYEEMEQKIGACLGNSRFQKLIAQRDITFNGKRVTGIYWAIDEFKRCIKQSYINPVECFTHGNITLENVLYQPDEKLITLIDPYEENIIDSKLAEYSQILQSSNSYYEIYNATTPSVSDSNVEAYIEIPPGISCFNKLFFKHLEAECTKEELRVVRLFEISQYVRMLPFKMEIDEDKMELFYCLASYLFSDLLDTFSG
ncbi:phosphotransferase [Polynucleobacter sp. 80A-SIGWE]|uniref:phosphotransferase n=1 Tax=Polynucleobacter sp. 80A-SIGWE TaxID=2689100 RepID=UPI001C0D878D|nr:phosphotransferase [Polynucleobacter sp. 80A-SIGWE]MBU3589066.1 phosphotransferase [Polynucleobacter sp. 80A-SIGWE]